MVFIQLTFTVYILKKEKPEFFIQFSMFRKAYLDIK